MKLTLLCLAVASICAGSAMTAHAATSADLTIQGQITPPACDLSFADSTVDMGTRTFGFLGIGGTILPTQNATMNIACSGATRVSFSAIDNRPGTSIASSDVTVWPALAMSTDTWVWGLGTAGASSSKIGGVEISMAADKPIVNGSATVLGGMQLLYADLGSGAFYRNSTSNATVYALKPTRHYTFGITSVPATISTASVPLRLSAVIARPASLPAEDEINLDGSLTFSLHYL